MLAPASPRGNPLERSPRLCDRALTTPGSIGPWAAALHNPEIPAPDPVLPVRSRASQIASATQRHRCRTRDGWRYAAGPLGGAGYLSQSKLLTTAARALGSACSHRMIA